MAKQFSVFTIRPDGLDGKKGTQYEASVLGMFRALDSFKTGRALLDGFRSVRREVLVFPYSGKINGKAHRCNAYATSDWGMYRNKVSYSPGTWSASSGCSHAGSAGASPMEVLFHELVHALRFASKTLQKRATSGQEEEIAIVVTNILSSETNRSLRWNHNGFDKLPSSDPVAFYGKNLALIKMFVKEHPKVSMDLSHIWTKFNPLREYYDREL
jgi:hypothetical protein